MPSIHLIYVNPIEYHGPHLTLKNDFEISRGLATRLMERIQKKNSNLQITRTFEIHRGCDPAAGPGTEFTSLPILKKIILNTCEESLKDKPDFVLFMTFHGAPKHANAMEAGIRFFESKGIPAYNPFNWVLNRLCNYDPSWVEGILKAIPDQKFAKEWQRKLPQDFHGGLFETSVMLAIDPKQVPGDLKTVIDCPDRKINLFWKSLIALLKIFGLKRAANEIAIGADALAWNHQNPYFGYTSAPRFATAEIGNYFIDIFLDDYERGFYEIAAKKAKSPRPVMQWTVALS